jgi:hypothetical protein
VKKVGCTIYEEARDRGVLGRDKGVLGRMTILWEQNLIARMPIKRKRREY